MNQSKESLWRHANFVRLWFGQTISSFGSQIGGGALRFTAILLLAATPWQLSFLSIAALLPTLLLGLLAGVWIDRLRKRPLLVAADVSRALILLVVPLAFVAGMLRIEVLYVVAASTGVFAMLFDIAYRAYLPHVVGRAQLVEANSKLGVSESLAEIAGPPLGGVLVQLISAPFAVLFDALSFLGSALLIGLIRRPEPISAATKRESAFREARTGLRAVAASPLLRSLLGAAATRSFAGGIISTLYDLFLLRELELPPAAIGLSIGVGGVSALGGALLTERVVARFGAGRTLRWTMALAGIELVIPFAHGPMEVALPMILLAQATDAIGTIAEITALSTRQQHTTNALLGRVDAGFAVATTAALLLGTLAAGVLAELVGVRWALGCGIAILVVAPLWVQRVEH